MPPPKSDTWDHPRACGEKATLRFVSSRLSGSPPRLRGEVPSVPRHPAVDRITPAPAGRSWFMLHASFKYWDHPRACGEKTERVQYHLERSGSPPRLRGEALLHQPLGRLLRITPAPAGRRDHGGNLNPTKRDHPRACGEKHTGENWNGRHRGSPPRLRGEVDHVLKALDEHRITPAPAGRSRILQRVRVRARDHPRACGEKRRNGWLAGVGKGSPPRLRGEGRCRLVIAPGTRITPAPAGRSRLCCSSSVTRWDHPRACGEKFVCRVCLGFKLGSPPRLRGEEPRTSLSSTVARITPAPAGRSGIPTVGREGARDHPRACGEKTSPVSLSTSAPGSPPRLRGEAFRIRAPLYSTGITPAPAGRSVKTQHKNQLLRDHPRACGEKEWYDQPNVLCVGSPPRLRGEVERLPTDWEDLRITPAPAGRRSTKPMRNGGKRDHPRACGEKSPYPDTAGAR